jgi:hypothetical protein
MHLLKGNLTTARMLATIMTATNAISVVLQENIEYDS